ncbi:MAG: formylmethanofuran dehydrogenase subunit E family protein [Methanomicrobia archaeon]|nr:formylmethanofuran dehydrogenase subunit E family protein [Methanomicrobia archaeon]
MSILKRAAEFHGHLGPYLVLGLKMGVLAKNTLNADPFEIRAEIHTEKITPRSCILDGIQFTSGCTLGKGNIDVMESDEIFGVFYKDNSKILIKVKKEILEKIEKVSDMEEYARILFEKKDEELFEYDKVKKC